MYERGRGARPRERGRDPRGRPAHRRPDHRRRRRRRVDPHHRRVVHRRRPRQALRPRHARRRRRPGRPPRQQRRQPRPVRPADVAGPTARPRRRHRPRRPHRARSRRHPPRPHRAPQGPRRPGRRLVRRDHRQGAVTPMDRREIAALLAYVDRLAPARAPPDQAAAPERADQWATLLAHVPATAQHPDGPERSWDASQVAARYIATTPYPIKPSDIGAPWETYRADVMNRHHDPAPAVDPDDWKAYRDAPRGTRHAVAVGGPPPPPPPPPPGPPPPPPRRPRPVRAQRDAEAARRLAALGDSVPRTVRDALADSRPHRAARERLAAAGQPAPLDVPCPYEHCRADPGKPCRDHRGNPRPTP